MGQVFAGRGAYYGDTRVLVNRTNRVLTARVDNQEWVLEPGDNVVPAFVVPFAIAQNPRRGTMQMSGEVESLIGCEGVTPADWLEMLEPGADGQQTADLIDRTMKPLVGEHINVPLAKSSSVVLEGATKPEVIGAVDVGAFD